jgi:hypothetical protein
MTRTSVVFVCVCMAALSATSATAGPRTVFPSTVEGHVDTVLAPGIVEGSVSSTADAPSACTDGRKVQLLAENGTVVAAGRTAADGTFSIPIDSSPQQVRVRSRPLEQGRSCGAAQDFITYYVA